MISINFSSRNYRLIRQLQTSLVVLSIFLALGAAFIIGSWLSVRSGAASMDAKVKQIEAAEEEVRPLLAERDRVVKDLTAMSGLLESRRFSWTKLLTDIEKVFPIGVALVAVEYNRGEHSLALSGAAQSPEALRNLVLGLEKTPAFKDPYLKNQSIDKGSISFHVTAFYQETGAAGLVQEK